MSGKGKRYVANLIMLAGLSTLGGCAWWNNAPPPVSVDNAALLTASRWELVSWSGHDLPNGDDGEPVVLNFSEGEHPSVSGRSWCNRFNAPYVVRDNTRLTVGHAAATRMICKGPAMEFEVAFLDHLQALERFQIRDNILELRAADGEMMRLQARPK